MEFAPESRKDVRNHQDQRVIAKMREKLHGTPNMSYTGTVHNGVVVLPPEAQLPDGTEVEVTPVVTANQAAAFTDTLLVISQKVRELPADLARNHNHYLHGHPRV